MNKNAMEAIFLVIVFIGMWCLSAILANKDIQIKALQNEVKQLKETK